MLRRGDAWPPRRRPADSPPSPPTPAPDVGGDTPKWSRNKFVLDEGSGLFKVGGVVPAGAVFPCDFGFVPATVGGDGDPMDALILDDRPIAVSTRSRNHREVREIGVDLVEEIEHCFVSHNQAKGEVFKPPGRHGDGRARRVVEVGATRHREEVSKG